MNNTHPKQQLILYFTKFSSLFNCGDRVFVFGLSCCHTASTPLTAGTHTSGAQYKGIPQQPDRNEQHSRMAPVMFINIVICASR